MIITSYYAVLRVGPTQLAVCNVTSAYRQHRRRRWFNDNTTAIKHTKNTIYRLGLRNRNFSTITCSKANLQTNRHQQHGANYHANILEAGRPSCRPTNNVRAPKGKWIEMKKALLVEHCFCIMLRGLLGVSRSMERDVWSVLPFEYVLHVLFCNTLIEQSSDSLPKCSAPHDCWMCLIVCCLS